MRRRLLHVLARVHGKHRLIDYNNDMTTTMRKLLREERNFETNDRDTYQESLCQQLFMFPPRLPGYPEEFHVVVSEMPPMVGINAGTTLYAIIFTRTFRAPHFARLNLIGYCLCPTRAW